MLNSIHLCILGRIFCNWHCQPWSSGLFPSPPPYKGAEKGCPHTSNSKVYISMNFGLKIPLSDRFYWWSQPGFAGLQHRLRTIATFAETDCQAEAKATKDVNASSLYKHVLIYKHTILISKFPFTSCW